jgi:hypothetical protein
MPWPRPISGRNIAPQTMCPIYPLDKFGKVAIIVLRYFNIQEREVNTGRTLECLLGE